MGMSTLQAAGEGVTHRGPARGAQGLAGGWGWEEEGWKQ